MNIVFDCAGVLFDWEPRVLVTRLLPQRVRTTDDAQTLVRDIFQGFGDDWGDFDRGWLSPGVLAQRIAARTGLSVTQSRSVIDAVPLELRLNPEMERVVQNLQRRGHVLHYLSNMPAPYADHLEGHCAIFDRFESGVFSGRVGLIKPQAEIYAHAIEVFEAQPEATLFIDDVAANVEAARRSGWQALRFEDSRQCEQALSRLGLL